MTRGSRRRSGWVALCVSSLARALLGVLASLLLWAVVPTAFGLQPTVVMTGSMLPRLVPGDVVFSRPVPADRLHLGQTLLYPDPDRPGHLRLHRWVDVAADGRLVTQGDANRDRDSTPIAAADVDGVASLRVPFVARPVVWLAGGRPAPLLLTALGLLLTVVAACWFRAADDEDTSDEPGDSGGSERDLTTFGPTTLEPGAVRRAWPRRVIGSGAALVVTLAVMTGVATAAGAAAKFTETTVNPANTLSAASYFSCAGAARGDGASLAYPLQETSGTVADDIGPYALDGAYAGGYTRTSSGPCAGRSVTLNGSTGQVVTPAGAKFQGPDTFTWEIWFRTASGYSRGGKLIGFDSSQSGSGGQYDRHVYLTNTGQLVFGVYNGAVRTVDSGTTRYNDNRWHLVDAVLGPGGMALYVDGVRVDRDTTVTSAEDFAGWLRIGGGSLGGSWPSLPASNYVAGSIAYAAGYLTALSSTQIAGHYAVGKL